MEVDIRNVESSGAQCIRIGDGEWLSVNEGHTILFIEDEVTMVGIKPSDIDNLIKALEYSKGVWFS